jgi:hypothetical protein
MGRVRLHLENIVVWHRRTSKPSDETASEDKWRDNRPVGVNYLAFHPLLLGMVPCSGHQYGQAAAEKAYGETLQATVSGETLDVVDIARSNRRDSLGRGISPADAIRIG